MKAVCWMGTQNMQVQTVPDPEILNPRDAIIKVTSTAICGSDLHLYDGYMPTLEPGDIIGHEFMGEVVEVGHGVNQDKLKVGDRVVIPFTIACGNCFFCKDKLWSCCDNSNPNAWIAEGLMGYSPSGLFGYTHMLGGYAGGQAQYARVPFADIGPAQGPRQPHRRTGPFPVRYLPYWLHGRRKLPDQARRHRGNLGLRSGRPVCHPLRLHVWRRPRHCHR